MPNPSVLQTVAVPSDAVPARAHRSSFAARVPLTLLGLLLLTPALLAPAQGPPSAADHALPAALETALEAAAPAAIDLRHRIHANPELSNRETETAALVAAHLRDLGLEVQTGVAHTGVVGVLRGGRPGPVVAVRADMDALPVVEDTDLPYASTQRTEFLGQVKDKGHPGFQIGVAVDEGAQHLVGGGDIGVERLRHFHRGEVASGHAVADRLDAQFSQVGHSITLGTP